MKFKIIGADADNYFLMAFDAHARIIKCGNFNDEQIYGIMKDGKIIKRSFYPYKLLDWFTKRFPKEILQIKIKGVDNYEKFSFDW